MAQDEDIELKDLLTEALEKNGVLAKIRAQLRASIFMTLENENIQKHQNPRLKDVLSTRDGVLSLLLVQELVEFCNLIQTASIFKAETGQGNTYTYEGRQSLLENLKLSGDSAKSDFPVLVQLVQLLIKLSKSSQADSPANSGSAHDTSNERSYNESEGSPNVAQNNTFLVNSGRSDNYELSFVSDSESSVQEDKSATVLPLNLNHSSESNDSLSTEIQGKQSSKDDSVPSESSIKAHVSSQEHADSVSSADISQFSESAPRLDKDSTKKSNPNSYSKYLSEKHKQNKNKSESSDLPPVDNIMKHFINSNLADNSNESRSDQSISEEIIKAFSDGNTWTDGSPRTDSDASPAHLLDDTLPESPDTKLRVIREINHLKQQTEKNRDYKSTEHSIDFQSPGNLKNDLTRAKNEKNLDREKSSKGTWSPPGDLPALVINKNIKILPCYLKNPQPDPENIIKESPVDPVTGKNWPES